MKFTPQEICSISISKLTDRTNCTVKVMWAELRKSWKCSTRWQNCGGCPKMNNDLVKMTSWNGQEGNRACIPKYTQIFIKFHQHNQWRIWTLSKGRAFRCEAPKNFFGSPSGICSPLFNKMLPLFQVKGSPPLNLSKMIYVSYKTD